MFKPTFFQKMRERRLELSMTQRQAAELIGMSRSRWSNLECGHRRPTDTERREVAELLGLSDCFVPPYSINKTLLSNGVRLVECRESYFPHQDRSTHTRYGACRSRVPRLTAKLRSIVLDRSDSNTCQAISHRISCESWLEALYLLYLQASGAKPALIAPETLGRLHQPIVDDTGRRLVGLNPRPCFVLDGCFHFFQVSFCLSRIIRVDILRWDGSWSVVELDGMGHISSHDMERDRWLGLPVTRFRSCDVISFCQNLTSFQQAS